MNITITPCYICEICGYKDSVLQAMKDHETRCQIYTSFDIPDDELKSADGIDPEQIITSANMGRQKELQDYKKDILEVIVRHPKYFLHCLSTWRSYKDSCKLGKNYKVASDGTVVSSE